VRLTATRLRSLFGRRKTRRCRRIVHSLAVGYDDLLQRILNGPQRTDDTAVRFSENITTYCGRIEDMTRCGLIAI